MTPPATPSPAFAPNGKPGDETNAAVVKLSPHSAGMSNGFVAANALVIEVANAITTASKNAKFLYIDPPSGCKVLSRDALLVTHGNLRPESQIMVLQNNRAKIRRVVGNHCRDWVLSF